MSSNKSGQDLQIEPRLSRRLALLFGLAHGAALMAIAQLTALPWQLSLALAGFVVVNFILVFRLHVLGNAARSILMLVWNAEGEWSLVTAGGERLEAHLLPASLVHPLLIVLNFAVSGRGRWTTVLMPDSLDRRTHRQLLARLRTLNKAGS